MKQFFEEIKINTNGQALIEITDQILSIFNNTKIQNGILNIKQAWSNGGPNC